MSIPLKPSLNRKDWCYPRSRRFRFFRGVLRFWWLAFFLIYLPIVISNLCTRLFELDFKALTNGSKLTQTLLVDQLLPLLLQNPMLIIPMIVMVVSLIFAGYWVFLTLIPVATHPKMLAIKHCHPPKNC